MNDQEINTPRGVIPAHQFGVGQTLTMSSREVANLCGKEHKNVIRDIRIMLIGLYGQDHLEKMVPEQYRNRHSEYVRENAGAILNAIIGNGSKRSHEQDGSFPGVTWDRDKRGYISLFRLDKSHTMTLVAGYDVQFRKKIVDRWLELEEANTAKPLDFSNPAVIMGVIGHLQEQVNEQAGRLKTLDRLEAAHGSMCISDAAKTLGVERKFLFNFLSSRKWIFKRAGNKNWLAYDDKRKMLLLEHDDHLYMDNLGQERVATRVLVTAKGLVKLAELLEQPLH